MCTWKLCADSFSGLDKINCVIIMLFNACGYRKNIRVKNNILWRETNFINQYAVRARANFKFSIRGVSLTLLIKSHDNNGCSIPQTQFRMLNKLILSLFERNRIHDCLTLNTFQTSLDYRPFRTINHYRHTSNIWLGCRKVQESGHSRFTVEHAFVHIHINNLSAILNLLTRNI